MKPRRLFKGSLKSVPPIASIPSSFFLNSWLVAQLYYLAEELKGIRRIVEPFVFLSSKYFSPKIPAFFFTQEIGSPYIEPLLSSKIAMTFFSSLYLRYSSS
jgi:hypothetical protein